MTLPVKAAGRNLAPFAPAQEDALPHGRLEDLDGMDIASILAIDRRRAQVPFMKVGEKTGTCVEYAA